MYFWCFVNMSSLTQLMALKKHGLRKEEEFKENLTFWTLMSRPKNLFFGHISTLIANGFLVFIVSPITKYFTHFNGEKIAKYAVLMKQKAHM